MINLKNVSIALVLILALSGISCFNKSGEKASTDSGQDKENQTDINTIQSSEGDNANVDITEETGEAASSERPVVVLKTSMGDITLELFSNDAPRTVANFLSLIKSNFYDGVTWHRVIPDFMIQGGDPLSKDNNPLNDGTGGPGYLFEDEINSRKIERGVLAMANAGPNSNGSQFFILTAPAAAWLDGKHTVFGRVLEGMETVDAISRVGRDKKDRPLQNVGINDVIIANQ